MRLLFYLVPFIIHCLVLPEPAGTLQVMPQRKRPSAKLRILPMKSMKAMKVMKAPLASGSGTAPAKAVATSAKASMKRTNSSVAW